MKSAPAQPQPLITVRICRARAPVNWPGFSLAPIYNDGAKAAAAPPRVPLFWGHEASGQVDTESPVHQDRWAYRHPPPWRSTSSVVVSGQMAVYRRCDSDWRTVFSLLCAANMATCSARCPLKDTMVLVETKTLEN